MARLCAFLAAALSLVAAGLLAAAEPAGSPELPVYAPVVPGRAFHFPADHGAHPQFRTEWWYITGWLDGADGKSLGFQVTFFRFTPSVDQRNPSTFAPKQIVSAHAALSDPSVGKLLHAERTARVGFGLAQTSASDTDITLDGWMLKRNADNTFRARIGASEFAFDLIFTPTQPILLQGEEGYSPKGPLAQEASYYYSMPHLAVSGSIERGGRSLQVKGTAWLDREWSSADLDPNAVGWDWVGLNLDDGSALMAIQIRDAMGGAFWGGGTLRHADGTVVRLQPGEVRFGMERLWRSPRTGTEYPVERTLTLHLPSGERRWLLKPLFDDQELDTRNAGGPVYWEGAVRTDGGRGYLELTGYFQPLKL